MEYISRILVFAIALLMIEANGRSKGAGVERKYMKLGSFDENYEIRWGQDHVSKIHSGLEVQLSMDQSSGAGFESKNYYGSGLFQIRIKVPGGNSGGVVTAFYLISKGGGKQDEIDFEFLGDNDGKPITLQTNVFTDGEGDREERFRLWFNPTKHFHTYAILWNPYQIVFYVDNIPIRVFKNNKRKGVKYITRPMQVEASLWNGDDWATDGGRTKVNWAYSPFVAHFQGFSLSGCNIDSSSNDVAPCGLSKYAWNARKYRRLSRKEETMYKHMRKKYMNYGYCTDRALHPIPPKEC